MHNILMVDHLDFEYIHFSFFFLFLLRVTFSAKEMLRNWTSIGCTWEMHFSYSIIEA